MSHGFCLTAFFCLFVFFSFHTPLQALRKEWVFLIQVTYDVAMLHPVVAGVLIMLQILYCYLLMAIALW